MKKGISRLITIFMIAGTCWITYNFPSMKRNMALKRLNIPKEFKNYRRKGKRFWFDMGMYHIFFYDLDKDGYIDVFELFDLNLEYKHPYLYGFDINRDKSFTLDELLIDNNVDGLDGKDNSEIWLMQRQETKPKKYII